MDNVRFAYAKNRAEELGRDIFKEFVVPLFYDQLEIFAQKKSFVLIGGRGCGKTTLLRYLSHNTQFSPNRADINHKNLEYIGLYIRADTNFLSSLHGGDIDERTWKSAFQHSLACELGLEVIDSLYSINCTENRRESYGRLEQVSLEGLHSFDRNIGTTVADARSYLVKSRDQLALWINNLDVEGRKPLFLPGEAFVKRLIECLQNQLPYVAKSLFAVYIDEYENLHEYQQRIVNGLIKHGEFPLVFNVAVKRNGMPINETDGNESIQDTSDFREIDLEERLADDFPLFAAELLFSRLHDYPKSLLIDNPVDPTLLQDVNKVGQRRDNGTYKTNVINAARHLLPRLSERDIAFQILKTPHLRSRLERNIVSGLKLWNSGLDSTTFIRDDAPDASLVASALLNRKKERPETILEEIENYTLGKPNRFSNGEWLHNNLFGCILQLYSSGQTPCPLFSGFDNFVLMSRNNVRYFLEIIHKAFIKIKHESNNESLVISVEEQAIAVREASSDFLRQVRGCWRYGNQLHGMALTLGAIFSFKQKNIAQSEPEINHFHILAGDINEQLHEYLHEAEKWSVLYEEEETKKKSAGAKTSEYVLNPVFSGHFQISFKKKRSIAISAPDLLMMFNGDVKQRDSIVKKLVGQDSDNFELDLGGSDE